MTVSTTVLKSGPDNTDGSTVSFQIAFPYISQSDVVVSLLNVATGVITVGNLNSDYSIADNVFPAIGGVVTILANAFGGAANGFGKIPAGYTLTRSRAMSIVQPQAYPNGGTFPSAAAEQGYDRLTLIAQQLQLGVNQSVKTPVVDGAAGFVLPAAGQRANKFLAFDSSGAPIASQASEIVSSAMAPVVSATTLYDAQVYMGVLSSGGNVGAVQAGDYLLYSSATGPQILFEGDSLTAGANGTYPPDHYITMPLWNGSAFTKTSDGHPGQTLLYLAQAAYANINPHYAPFSGMNVVVLWGGINDIAMGQTTPEVYSRLVSLSRHLKSLGWRVLVCTLFSALNFETQRVAFNGLVQNNWWQFADGIIDLASDATLGPVGACSNATYFQPDGIHLKDAGYALVGALEQTAIENFLITQNVSSAGGAPFPTGTVGHYIPSSGMVGTSQYGTFIAPTFSAQATAQGEGLAILTHTAASAFTLPVLYNLYVAGCAKGAGSTVTTQYGIYLPDLTAGVTNWGFYSAGANTPNFFAGVTSIGLVPAAQQGQFQVYSAASGGAPAASGTTDANQVLSTSIGSVQLRQGFYASGDAWIQNSLKTNFATNNKLILNPNGGAVISRGRNLADDAGSGNIGEWLQSRVTAATNVPAATTVVGDATSLVLTAGDWDISAAMTLTSNGATVTGWSMGIGTAAGNNTTGCQLGDNYFSFLPPVATAPNSGMVANFRVSVSSTTTFYQKIVAAYTVATPQYQCRLSARRC